MIMHGDYADPLNLGSNELVTINHLVDLAEEIGGVKLVRRLQPLGPEGCKSP